MGRIENFIMQMAYGDKNIFNNEFKKITKYLSIGICHLHNKIFISADFEAKKFRRKLETLAKFLQGFLDIPGFSPTYCISHGEKRLLLFHVIALDLKRLNTKDMCKGPQP